MRCGSAHVAQHATVASGWLQPPASAMTSHDVNCAYSSPIFAVSSAIRCAGGHPLTEASANRRVEIIFADVQGKEENLRESARYRPACFVSDGSHRREM